MTKKITYEDVSYSSLNEIREEILKGETAKVCNHMAGAGMYCDDIQEMYSLIELCLESSDEWIRNAGFINLYHINFRLGENADQKKLIIFLEKGLLDHSKDVRYTINDIMRDMHEFNYESCKKLSIANKH